MLRRDLFLSLLPTSETSSPVASTNNNIQSLQISVAETEDRRSFIRKAAGGLFFFRKIATFTAVILHAACTQSCGDPTEYSFLGNDLEKGFASKEDVQAKIQELKKLSDPINAALPAINSFLNDYRSKGPALFAETHPELAAQSSDWTDGQVTYKDFLRHTIDKVVIAFSVYESKKDAFPQKTLDLLWETQKLASDLLKSLSPEPANTPSSRKAEGFELQWLKNDGNGHEILVNLEADLELIAANLEYDIKQLENATEDKDENDKPRWYPNSTNLIFRDAETFASYKRLESKDNWTKSFTGDGSFYDAYTAGSSGSSTTRQGHYRLGAHK